MYYLLRREREEQESVRRSFDIAFWVGETPSSDLARFWCRQVRLVQDPMPRLFTKVLTVVSWYWLRDELMSRHVVDLMLPHQVASEELNSSRYSAARFMTRFETSDVKQCLRNLGVESGRPYALIHVRNSGHDLRTSRTYEGRLNDADPGRFQKAVDLLVGIDHSVITFGNDPSSPSGLRGAIEYHSSAERTPLRDFTLASSAALYVGTAAGAPSGAAINFRIPTLLTNCVMPNANVTTEPFDYGRSVVVPKNIRFGGMPWSLSESLSRPFPESDRGIALEGISVEDNDEDDILAALLELLALVNGETKWEESRCHHDQLAFFRVFDAHSKLARRCPNESAIISPSFLRKYPHWLR
jgi:putative glycosyltransferase (TIGR04372 family)